jgi:hypothetical protein
MLGDVEQALGNYQHAISLGAGDALAYGNLAYNYFPRRPLRSGVGSQPRGHQAGAHAGVAPGRPW